MPSKLKQQQHSSSSSKKTAPIVKVIGESFFDPESLTYVIKVIRQNDSGEKREVILSEDDPEYIAFVQKQNAGSSSSTTTKKTSSANTSSKPQAEFSKKRKQVDEELKDDDYDDAFLNESILSTPSKTPVGNKTTTTTQKEQQPPLKKQKNVEKSQPQTATKQDPKPTSTSKPIEPSTKQNTAEATRPTTSGKVPRAHPPTTTSTNEETKQNTTTISRSPFSGKGPRIQSVTTSTSNTTKESQPANEQDVSIQQSNPLPFSNVAGKSLMYAANKTSVANNVQNEVESSETLDDQHHSLKPSSEFEERLNNLPLAPTTSPLICAADSSSFLKMMQPSSPEKPTSSILNNNNVVIQPDLQKLSLARLSQAPLGFPGAIFDEQSPLELRRREVRTATGSHYDDVFPTTDPIIPQQQQQQQDSTTLVEDKESHVQERIQTPLFRLSSREDQLKNILSHYTENSAAQHLRAQMNKISCSFQLIIDQQRQLEDKKAKHSTRLNHLDELFTEYLKQANSGNKKNEDPEELISEIEASTKENRTLFEENKKLNNFLKQSIQEIKIFTQIFPAPEGKDWSILNQPQADPEKVDKLLENNQKLSKTNAQLEKEVAELKNQLEQSKKNAIAELQKERQEHFVEIERRDKEIANIRTAGEMKLVAEKKVHEVAIQNLASKLSESRSKVPDVQKIKEHLSKSIEENFLKAAEMFTKEASRDLDSIIQKYCVPTSVDHQ